MPLNGSVIDREAHPPKISIKMHHLGPLIKSDNIKEEKMCRMWSRSESPDTSEVLWRKEAWRLEANLDYFIGLCDKGDWETGVKTDVWPRWDECDFKPGVRTFWSITKKWNMNDFPHSVNTMNVFQIKFGK